jgi:hypothetical protein
MYRLTERRFIKAKPILDHFRKQLHSTGWMSASDLEMELRKCWKIGYRELKNIIIELSKQSYYRHLAVAYMESNGPGPVMEFKRTLAKIYGIKSYDHSPNRESKRDTFWRKLKVKRN